ncbi:MAG TPA: hypothetical protein DCY93_03015 [Firmicutes bacterium]|nr:hypothetical protein [Bacillota bacterium]
MNKLSNDSKKSMLSRVITGCVLAVIGLPLMILGDWYSLAVILVLSLFAIYEMVSAAGKKRYSIPLIIVVYLFVLSFAYWQFFKDRNIWNEIVENHHFTLTNISLSTIGITVLFLLLFLVSIVDKNFMLSDVCYLFSLSVFLGIGIYSTYFLRFFPEQNIYYGQKDLASCLLFFYVMVGAFMSDIGAYFVGVLFGKHPMNPRISPKKSWEGFFGGLVFSIATSMGFAAICEALGKPILPGILDFKGLHWLWLLLISFIMPITANIGDFLFSSIKRSYAIKDFGTILPGHGGVLDRCDSLLVTNLVVSILVLLISNNWNFLL